MTLPYGMDFPVFRVLRLNIRVQMLISNQYAESVNY